MTIKKRTGFTMIPTALLWDKSISLNAKAIYGVIKSSVPGWNPSVKGYSCVMKEGKTAISNAIAELERTGYITRSYKRDKSGKYCSTIYQTHEEPVSDLRDSDKPSPDYSVTIKQVGNITSDETISKDINNEEIISNEDNTVCLTGDIEIFEKYLRRQLSPSEYSVWERWKKNGVRSDFIQRAVEENEFRGVAKMTLHHVDATLKLWDEQGFQTMKDIENFILDHKDMNTGAYLKRKYEYDDERSENEYKDSKVYDLKVLRDDLLHMFKADEARFFSVMSFCSTEVYKYLPNDVLDKAALYFKENGKAEREIAARNAMEKVVNT